MKVLVCHTYYQQPGGEDRSFEAEARLLEQHGHSVIRYTRRNDELNAVPAWRVAGRTVWNAAVCRDVRRLVREHRPDILHCTNTFPLLSPSVYYAARQTPVAVVQSLRNYRFQCVNSFFFRDGGVCEACLGRRFAWPGVLHACYRDSRAGSAAVALMQSAHRLAGTWHHRVDQYFAVSEFARRKFIEGGLPADRVSVKPNFIAPDPGPGAGRGGYALFVGRLSAEKGIDMLLDAWTDEGIGLPLKLVGDGPLRARVVAAAARCRRIEWMGPRPERDVLRLVGDAACLVMPSLWYETFGRTIIEAYAKGTPVVVSRLGAMQELVDDGRTGWLVEPGNRTAWAAQIDRVGRMRDLTPMRRQARRAYEARFTAERNYTALLEIYERALARRRGGRAAGLAPVVTAEEGGACGF